MATPPAHVMHQRLARLLQQRHLLADDAIAQRALAKRTGPLIDALSNTYRFESADPSTRPPRRVAVALALALFSHPHLANTFDHDLGPGEPPTDRAITPSDDVLEATLGLPKWELDDLREEVDRRAGWVMKSRTMVNWLWSRFGMPNAGSEPLFRLLFPGHQNTGCELIRRGSQLYALLPQAQIPSISTLYLTPQQATTPIGMRPTEVFRGRYVAPSLLRSISRGLGLDGETAHHVLESAITVLPRERAEVFLRQDRWRYRGYGLLCGLGVPYSDYEWLTKPLMETDLEWQEWILKRSSSLTLRRPSDVFDAFMAQRVQAAIEQRVAEILAETTSSESSTGRGPESLDRYELASTLQLLAEPLLQWTTNPIIHDHIADHVQLPSADVRRVLSPCRDLWATRLEQWLDEDAQSKPGPIHYIIQRVAGVDGVVRRLYHQQPDSRWPHRDLLLFFAGHYMADTPYNRQILTRSPESDHAAKAIGSWFWPAWIRLLTAVEREMTTTSHDLLEF